MIKKAIIPVAGKGTRMAPITNIIAKEMLPIGTKPTLQYIVEEAVASGIEQILFVINHEKGMVAKYFAGTEEPRTYDKGGMYEYNCLGKQIGIGFNYQGNLYGSGSAVLRGMEFADGQTVAILFGDDIIVGNPAATKQLIDVSVSHDYSSVIGVQSQSEEILRTCALVVGDAETDHNGLVSEIIEKPKGELKGDLTSLGRFVLDAKGFEVLRNTPVRNGELWLTDALNAEAKYGRVQYCKFTGDRYDVGNKFGYIHTFNHLAVDEQNKLAFQEYVEGLRR